MQKIVNEIDTLQSEINKHRPLDPDLLKQIKEYYRIGLTYTSNALEGNTLTESETKVVLEEGITIGGKPLKDHLEAQGASEAYDFVYQLISKKEISEEDIKKLHKLFYYRIDEKNAGTYRNKQVFLTGSKYPTTKPDKIASEMSKFIANLEQFRETEHPVVAAALAHKEFVFIHPFIDPAYAVNCVIPRQVITGYGGQVGNGRVARLFMNLILLQEGYNIAIIPPIMRAKYISSLEKAHTNDSDFLEFIAQMLKETQKDYIRLFES